MQLNAENVDWLYKGDKMKWDFNKQVTTVIIVFIALMGIAVIVANFPTEVTITYNIVMDNNTLEAVKSINYSALQR